MDPGNWGNAANTPEDPRDAQGDIGDNTHEGFDYISAAVSEDSVIEMSGNSGSIPGAVFPGGGTGFVGTIPKKKANKTGGTKDDAKTDNAPEEGKSKAAVNKGSSYTSGKGKGSHPEGKKAVRRNPIPNHILKVWADEKRCLGCGSSDHWRSNCPTNPPTGMRKDSPSGSKSKGSQPKDNTRKSSKASPAKSNPSSDAASAQSGQRGVKRDRGDLGQSGLTPPAKKGAKKFSYAAAAATGALEVAIVTKDKAHISKRDFYTIRAAVDDAWMKQLDAGKVEFEVDSWLYTSQMATFCAPNADSAGQVEKIIREHGFFVMKKETLMEERKPTRILSGLVTGPTAGRDRKVLERLLKYEADRVGVTGRLEYYSSHLVKKSGNLILKLVADDEAIAGLTRCEFELRLGASGKVKFQDERADKKTSRQTKLEELESRIKEQKQLLQQAIQERRALEDVETASVGSMGVSKLHVGGTDDSNVGDADREMDTLEEELLGKDEPTVKV